MFEHATGFKTAPNVTTYNARFYQGRYIIGQIAAKMSKTGTAGYIVSFPIPEVIMGINSFMLGAQSVNPDFKLKIVWINTWMDPAKEGDAAKALFDQGVDIITQHTDSTEPLKIAEERGLHGFGQSHDMIDAAPKAQLHLAHRQLGSVLHRPHQGGDGRHLEVAGELGRPGGGHGADGALHQPARRRRRGRQGHPGEDHDRRVPSLHRPDRQAGRHRGDPGRPGAGRRCRCSPWTTTSRASTARRAPTRPGQPTRSRLDGRAPDKGAPVPRTAGIAHVRLPRRMAEPDHPLGPSRGGHRLDRHVVLFHRPRPQPPEARGHAGGRLRHRLGGARRRLLSRREIPGRAEDAAARPDLVQVGGLPHLGHRLRAAHRPVLLQRPRLSDRPVGAAASAGAGGRHLGHQPRRRLVHLRRHLQVAARAQPDAARRRSSSS